MLRRVKVSLGMRVLLAGGVVIGAVRSIRVGRTAGDIWESLWPWAVVLAAAGIHELGHLAAARCAGVKVRGVRLDVFGARMELGGLLSYGQELAVSAGGPIASLLCAVLAYPPSAVGGEWMRLFFWASLLLGGVNLLPVGDLDGGRMLRSGSAWLWGDRAATHLLQGTSVLFAGLLWLMAVYSLLRAGQMLSLFVFSLCLLGRVVCGGREG